MVADEQGQQHTLTRVRQASKSGADAFFLQSANQLFSLARPRGLEPLTF